ncbi:MAG: repressor LexA [Rickettsiales bacterium]|jgi:repressor LexA
MKLHPKQEQLLSILEKNQNSPLPLSELVRQMDVSSNNLVLHHLKQLEKKGYLKRNEYNPSDYQVLTTPEKPISYINFYGEARCGAEGCFLDGDPQDRIPMASSLIGFKTENAFMIKAKGDSMEPNIFEGDFVIVQKKLEFYNDDIVVCSINGMAVIKQYFKDLYGNVLLKSFNKKHPTILLEEGDQIFIAGKVEHIIKNL